MTYVIIIVTVVVSIACFGNSRLFGALALVPYRVFKNKEWYRLITYGFVHADYTHLIINMLVFWSFGVYVERIFKMYAQARMIGNGTIDFLLLYFGGMVVATLHDLIKRRNDPAYVSIGASGAVSAVVFTSIFFNPWSKIYFFGILPIPGIIFGVLYLVYSQYMARRGVGNVNHTAHFYGALFGFVFPILVNPSLAYEFLKHFNFN